MPVKDCRMQKMVCVGTEEEATSLFDEFFCTDRQLSSWSSDSNIRAHIWQSVLHLPADVRHITSWWIRELVIGAEKSSSHDLVHGSFYTLCDVRAHFENFPLHFIAFHEKDDADHGRQAFGDPMRQTGTTYNFWTFGKWSCMVTTLFMHQLVGD